MFFDKGMQKGAAVVNDENLTNQEILIQLNQLELQYKLKELDAKLIAEKEVERAIRKFESRYPDQDVTFDLHVTANYQVTDTDGIITTLQKIKSYEDNQLDEIHKNLSGRQDPCRCLSVEYDVLSVKVDGVEKPHNIDIKPIGPDTDLDNFFNK